jgi:hypothetical protein
MQRALIASGVLGLGTALVFGAAALTATLFPNGSTVAATFNGGWERGGVMMGGGPVPMPAPVFAKPGIVVTDDTQVIAPDVAPVPTVQPGPTD